MKKVEAIEEIIDRYYIINKEIQECKASLYLDERMEELKYPMIMEGLKWLRSILKNEYHEIQKVLGLLPDKIWKQYTIMGDCDDLREMIMLKDARVAFRKAIVNRKRPILFKKGEVKNALKKKR